MSRFELTIVGVALRGHPSSRHKGGEEAGRCAESATVCEM